MKGDGVRHNRADFFLGSDDSWLPRGARSFLLAPLFVAVVGAAF